MFGSLGLEAFAGVLLGWALQGRFEDSQGGAQDLRSRTVGTPLGLSGCCGPMPGATSGPSLSFLRRFSLPHTFSRPRPAASKPLQNFGAGVDGDLVLGVLSGCTMRVKFKAERAHRKAEARRLRRWSAWDRTDYFSFLIGF